MCVIGENILIQIHPLRALRMSQLKRGKSREGGTGGNVILERNYL